MVEGGTLLRCYTSQRGIEGSNPSSSAPKVPRLQDQSEGEEVGRVRSLGVGNLGMLPATVTGGGGPRPTNRVLGSVKLIGDSVPCRQPEHYSG